MEVGEGAYIILYKFCRDEAHIRLVAAIIKVCYIFVLKKLSAFYICCIYSCALQTRYSELSLGF